MEADEKKEEVEEKKGVFQSMRFEAMQSKVLQAQQEVLLKEDPSVFAYDETKDSDDDEKLDGPELGKTWEDPSKSGGQKPSGLTVRGDGPIKRAAQYIDGVGRATLIRTLEQEIIEEKRLKKEREESGVHDEEVYVTNGYKDRLKQREEAQVKLNVKDAKDLAKCVTKQGESGGFALAGLAKSMMSATMRGRKGPEEVKKPEVKAESAVKTEDFF
jgi:hypothetical protein